MAQHEDGQPGEPLQEQSARQAEQAIKPSYLPAGTDETTSLELYRLPLESFETFNKVTSATTYSIAGIYFYSILDCLVELAFAVSQDFFCRPHLYIDLHRDMRLLAELNARYGTEEYFLDTRQRAAIYNGLFGVRAAESEEEQGEFIRLRDELIGACAAFAERVFDTGEDMLRERVRTTHRPFRAYLEGLNGDSLAWSREALGTLAEQKSYQILRNRGVASIFGIADPPTRKWPYQYDSNGDKLVAEITKQLAKGNRDRPGDERMPELVPITREQISNIQRVALRGTEALVAIIYYDESKDKPDDNGEFFLSQDLIKKCYTWGAALKAVEGPSAGPLHVKRPV